MFPSGPPESPHLQGSRAADDTQQSFSNVISALDAGNQNLSAQFDRLIAALGTVFPRVRSIAGGSFTMPVAASITVPQPLTAANSVVLLVATSASAATLMSQANALFLSARVANTSFTFSTAAGGNAVGTETFTYLMLNL